MNRLDTFPTEEMVKSYRNVFASREAPKVIAHMLFELGLFEDIPNMSAEDAALKNYGSRLLRILGGGEVKANALTALVRQVIAQPLKEKEEEEI